MAFYYFQVKEIDIHLKFICGITYNSNNNSDQ